MVKLNFYVPESHLEEVKAALFAAGGGRIGNYDCCCWQTLGEGQFRPGAGSNPYSGTRGEVERDREYKVELVCEDELIEDVVAALKQAHPYEEPAYDATRLLDV